MDSQLPCPQCTFLNSFNDKQCQICGSSLGSARTPGMIDNSVHSQSHSNTNGDTLNGNGILTEEEALKCALGLSLSNPVASWDFRSNNNNAWNECNQKKKEKAHNWIDCDEKEQKKEEENWKYGEHKIAILVFGRTGVGKGSLIGTMTDNKSSICCTKECEFYLNNGILWIDTKDALDVNEQSQDTLKNIGKNCYQNGITALKFIWCIDKSVQYQEAQS